MALAHMNYSLATKPNFTMIYQLNLMWLSVVLSRLIMGTLRGTYTICVLDYRNLEVEEITS